MSPKCIKYKDVYAAPGSELYQALVNQNPKLAEELYKRAKPETP